MNPNTFHPETTLETGPPKSKVLYVLDRLREEIAGGAFAPGTALKQTDIAQRYGVSPTPVREALRLLESEGHVAYVANRGAVVRDSASRVEDLYLLRVELEGLGAFLAVNRMDDKLTERLEAVHQQMVTIAGDENRGDELALLNRRFHFLLHETGSDVISTHISTIWQAFPPGTELWNRRDVVEGLLSEHQKIINAVACGNADMARRHMKDHLLHAGPAPVGVVDDYVGSELDVGSVK